MSWGTFIHAEVEKALLAEGYSSSVAQGGATEAESLYHRMSQASQRGKIFDDALRHARRWAEKRELPADRQRKKQTKRGNQPGLF